MRTLSILLVAAPLATATPLPWLREAFALITGNFGSLFEAAQHRLTPEILEVDAAVEKMYNDGRETLSKVVTDGRATMKSWLDEFGHTMVEQAGIVYEQVMHPSAELQPYSLHMTAPKLCDPDVKQHAGYLDITDGKHLFFWFFEARIDPENAPLLLWLNGGPGCSSSTGLLFELGPCSVSEGGEGTTRNPHSWNTNFNIIFLDQPVNVGYSYATDGSSINNTPAAALDVWAFLQLFLNRFPEYSRLPFHLAAESYGGHYAPHIASVIHKQNADLPSGTMRINLRSVILANGLTEPYTQMASVPDYACDGPFPVYDDPEGPECTALRQKVPTCQRLIKSCYDFESRLTCVPAALYCWSQLYGAFQQLGLNPYDVRRKCDRDGEDGQLCYKQMGWIDAWLNRPEVKKELGVSDFVHFEGCNMQVNQAFMFQGDGMHNSAALLPPLLEDGVRVLVYAGNADFMCNSIGNKRWMIALEGHPFAADFAEAEDAKWVLLDSGRVAGEVRSVGGSGFGAGNFTYAEVYDAGHMVPYDQPEAALDLIERWVFDLPLKF